MLEDDGGFGALLFCGSCLEDVLEGGEGLEEGESL